MKCAGAKMFVFSPAARPSLDNLRAQLGFYEQIGLEENVKFAKVLNNSKNTSKVKCKVVHIAA